MRVPALPGRRNVAVLAAAAIVGALGVGGVMSAQADDTKPRKPATSQVDQGDGDGETADDDAGENEANEGPEQNEADEKGEADGETDDDATDVGPDADPNEPGHQDASDADGSTE